MLFIILTPVKYQVSFRAKTARENNMLSLQVKISPSLWLHNKSCFQLDISLVRSAHSKIKYISTRGHVLSSMYRNNWKSTLNFLRQGYFYHVTAQLHLKSKGLLGCWLAVWLSLLPILSRSFHADSDRWRVCWAGAWWPVWCRGWFNLRNKLKNNETS